MNENINLCEILKGHEGETFYSPIFGDVELVHLLPEDANYPITVKEVNRNHREYFTKEGKYKAVPNSETLLFPSKDQRDWNKWIKEQNSTPKTWSDIIFNKTVFKYRLHYVAPNDEDYFTSDGTTPLEESALALLKIHQLIEIGYGGNLTNEEWITQQPKYLIVPTCYKYSYKFSVITTAFFTDKCHIAFHTEKQAEEFLKYEENIQLLRDYFML